MEYVRVRFSPLPAGFALSRGSSFSRESFREEAMPEREEDADDGKSSGSESASEASSRESRPGSCKGFWISENPRRDMTREGEVGFLFNSCCAHPRIRYPNPLSPSWE